MLFLKCPSFRLYYCLHAFVWTGILFSFSRTKTVSKHVAEIYWSLCKCSPEVWKTEVPLQAPCQWAFIFSKDSSYKKSLRNTVSVSALSDSMLGSGPDLSYFTNPQNFVGVKAVVFPTNGGEISLEYYQAWNHQYFNAKQGGGVSLLCLTEVFTATSWSSAFKGCRTFIADSNKWSNVEKPSALH